MTDRGVPTGRPAAPPEPLAIDAVATAMLTWSYDCPPDRIGALYESAKLSQWNASADIDWSIEVRFGEPLPDTSAEALRTFQASPLAGRGKPAWDAFRWAVQAWMACQFLHGEQAALVASARLVEALPDLQAKLYASSQAGDEARHTDAFARYVRAHVPDPYPISPALRELFQEGLRAREWDLTALAVQCLAEPIALAAFRVAETTFHDDLIKQIATKIARDEARHVSFGVMLLQDLLPRLSASEFARREELVLEAAALMCRRFLLGEIWERFEVPAAAGSAFAAADPGLAAYRRVLFSRVILMLGQVGLLTPHVLDGLGKLGLLGDHGTAGLARRARARQAGRS